MGLRKLRIDELNRPDACAFAQQPKCHITLLLDNIRSLQNVGAIMRTADAFALEGILLCGFTGTPPHREIHRAALGAEDTINWTHCKDPIPAISTYKEKGYAIVALEQCEGSISLNEYRHSSSSPILLILGNEVEGVQQALLDVCDAAIEIPQLGTKHSLNVATAAGIALWQLSSLAPYGRN